MLVVPNIKVLQDVGDVTTVVIVGGGSSSQLGLTVRGASLPPDELPGMFPSSSSFLCVMPLKAHRDRMVRNSVTHSTHQLLASWRIHD